MNLEALGPDPFDAVLDVGGNVGDFAELARKRWPDALVTSFEPVPELARENRKRSGGRWLVEEVAVAHRRGTFPIHVCVNQHSASTMMPPGVLRRERFGIRDTWREVMVPARPLGEYTDRCRGRTLVKIDVEGFEGPALIGARDVLLLTKTVVVECQQSPEIFTGSLSPAGVAVLLEGYGFEFQGVAGALLDPRGDVVQFDGVWTRP